MTARYGLSTGPGLYVEIGFGEAPIALHGPIPFSGAYLGFEAANGHGYPTSADVEKYASVVLRAMPGLARAQAGQASKRIALVFADARGKHGGLPLPDGCATEVYMANVLTSPLRAGDGERAQILREAMRILASGGGLVLRVSWGDDAHKDWRQNGSSGWSAAPVSGSSVPARWGSRPMPNSNSVMAGPRSSSSSMRVPRIRT
jgi:hypothetical protein